MTVYIPVFDGGKRQVWEEDGSLLRWFTKESVCKHKPRVGFYGNVYNANSIFKTEAAAWAWWNRDNVNPKDVFTDFQERD